VSGRDPSRFRAPTVGPTLGAVAAMAAYSGRTHVPPQARHDSPCGDRLRHPFNLRNKEGPASCPCLTRRGLALAGRTRASLLPNACHGGGRVRAGEWRPAADGRGDDRRRGQHPMHREGHRAIGTWRAAASRMQGKTPCTMRDAAPSPKVVPCRAQPGEAARHAAKQANATTDAHR
jgi:hypothetical protein